MAEEELCAVPTTTNPKDKRGQVSLPTKLEDLPPFLTVDETAALLRTSSVAVYSMAERGRLAGVTRVGRRLLVNRDELLRSLEQSRVPSPKKGVRR